MVIANILKKISVKFQTITMKNYGVMAIFVQESRKITQLWCESIKFNIILSVTYDFTSFLIIHTLFCE